MSLVSRDRIGHWLFRVRSLVHRTPAWLRDWSPELLFLVVTTVAGIWAGGRWLDTTGDPGVWLSFAERVAHGERCYRDLYIQYGPLSPYLLSVTGQPFGFSLTWFLLANWIPAIVAGLLLLRAGRPLLTHTERLALVGLLIGLSVFAPRPARMVLPYSPAAVHALCFAVGAFLLVPSRRRGPSAAYGAGILAGLALCEKQEIGVAAIVGLCALLLTEGRKGVAWVSRCLIGFVLVAAIGVVAIVSTGASVDSLIHDSHLWPLASVPREWQVLSRGVAGIAVVDWRQTLEVSIRELVKLILLVSLAALCLGRETSRRRWWLTPAPMTLLVLSDLFWSRSILPEVRPVGLSMTVAFVVALLAWLDRSRPGRDFLVGFAVFAGLVGVRLAFSSHISGPYSGIAHFATSLTWFLFLLCLVPEAFPGGASSGRWSRRVWALILMVVSWYWGATGIENLAESGRIAVSTPRGVIYVEPRMKILYANLGQELRAGERALFLPETSGLDVLFGVRDASPFLSLMPGWLDSHAEEILVRRFEAAPPDVIVVFVRTTREFGVEPYGRGFGRRLAAWIEQRYRAVKILPGASVLRPRDVLAPSLPVP